VPSAGMTPEAYGDALKHLNYCKSYRNHYRLQGEMSFNRSMALASRRTSISPDLPTWPLPPLSQLPKKNRRNKGIWKGAQRSRTFDRFPRSGLRSPCCRSKSRPSIHDESLSPDPACLAGPAEMILTSRGQTKMMHYPVYMSYHGMKKGHKGVVSGLRSSTPCRVR
jgi:hypothetical protein